ncbi:hypothetical protein BKA62DRAFT_813444 [Auriculariales sp. MPI-PUGE-AT-0066]|nr:hypothetical protein BKA62DRAFT_813444 [Auriculariales sp. MPI-PUGE-AT-0066]
MPAAYIDLTADDNPSKEIIDLVSVDDEREKQHEKQSTRRARRQEKRSRKKRQDEPAPAAKSSRTDRVDRSDRRERERDRNRDHDRDRERRKRSRSRSASPARRSPQPDRARTSNRSKRKRDRSPTPFMIDTSATILPNIDLTIPTNTKQDESGLLLPQHVKVIADAAAQLNDEEREQTPLSEVSFIQVIDLDPDARKTQRYFEEEPVNRLQTCSICNEPGHFARTCSMVVVSVDLYISHLLWQLSSRHSVKHAEQRTTIPQVVALTARSASIVTRKGISTGTVRTLVPETNPVANVAAPSFTSQTWNCPSLWRTYTYLLPHERDELLQQRLLKRNAELGVDQGGEGFIGAEDWCYNCAGCGHLGDDCPQASSRLRPGDRHSQREASAFSALNMSRGPYGLAEPHATLQHLRDRSRSPPPRAGPSVLPDAHRRPGQQGRMKQADDLRKAQRRYEEQDDAVDVLSQLATKASSRSNHRNGDSGHRDSNGDRSRRDREKDRRGGHRDRNDDRPRDRGDDQRSSKSLKDRLSDGYGERRRDDRQSARSRNAPRYNGSYS